MQISDGLYDAGVTDGNGSCTLLPPSPDASYADNTMRLAISGSFYAPLPAEFAADQTLEKWLVEFGQGYLDCDRNLILLFILWYKSIIEFYIQLLQFPIFTRFFPIFPNISHFPIGTFIIGAPKILSWENKCDSYFPTLVVKQAKRQFP